MNITIDLDTALESLDNILMTDKERYASMEAYLDELVSRDSYDDVNALFESVNEYDSVMEEENENNKKSIIEKIKKAIAWLKKKFFDIISAIGIFFKNIINFFKNLLKRKFKSRNQKIVELEREIIELKKELEISRIENDSLNKSNADLKERVKNLRNANSELRLNYNSSLREIDKLRSDYESEKSGAEIERLEHIKERELVDMLHDAEKKNMQIEIDHRDAKLKRANDEISELKNKNRDQESIIAKARSKIYTLEAQIEFLKNDEFDEKFEKRIRSTLSIDKINALIMFTDKSMLNRFNVLSDISKKIEECLKKCVINSSNDISVIAKNMQNIERKIDYLIDKITHPEDVKNISLKEYIHDPSVFFDQQRINSVKTYSENFKKNSSKATELIKSQLNMLTEMSKKITNQSDNRMEYNLKYAIESTNTILTRFGRFSSISANYTMKIVNSVLEVQKIYLSLLDGRTE